MWVTRLLAVVILGPFGLQAMALPAHDVQHSLQRTNESQKSHSPLIKEECGLCLAYHANTAMAAFVSILDCILLFNSYDGIIFSNQIDSDFILIPDARAPPFLS